MPETFLDEPLSTALPPARESHLDIGESNDRQRTPAPRNLIGTVSTKRPEHSQNNDLMQNASVFIMMTLTKEVCCPDKRDMRPKFGVDSTRNKDC